MPQSSKRSEELQLSVLAQQISEEFFGEAEKMTAATAELYDVLDFVLDATDLIEWNYEGWRVRYATSEQVPLELYGKADLQQQPFFIEVSLPIEGDLFVEQDTVVTYVVAREKVVVHLTDHYVKYYSGNPTKTLSARQTRLLLDSTYEILAGIKE